MLKLLLIVVALIAAFVPAAHSAQTRLRPGGPLRIVLLVDSSTTVSRMLNSFRAGLRGFFEELPGDSEIAIVTTGGQFRIRVPPTSDRQLLAAAVENFSPDGGGNVLFTALLEADARLMKTAPDRRPVFVILAADVNADAFRASINPYNKFLGEFLERGGRAHAVIVRSTDPTGMTTEIAKNLTENTGGFYETVLSATAIPALMKTMAAYVAADQ